jgi:hypothetical protein
MLWPKFLLYGIVLIHGIFAGYQLGIAHMLRRRINDFVSLEGNTKKDLRYYSRSYLFFAFFLILVGLILIVYFSGVD